MSGDDNCPRQIADLLERAKQSILLGMDSWRAATEDMAAGQEQGASQRQIAKAVGKSAAWVHQMLKWRREGYKDDTPFGLQSKASRRRANGVQATERGQQLFRDSAPNPGTLTRAVHSFAPDQIGSDDLDPLADAEIDPRAEAISTGGISASQRHDLIERLEMLAYAKPMFRAKFALNVEKRRAELGLTWDQLIIPANGTDANAVNRTDEEAAS
jgi:hypothetical protein